MNESETISIIEPVGGYGGMDFYDYGLAIGLAKTNSKVRLYTCNETIHREAQNLTTIKSFGNVWKKNKLAKFFAFYGGYLRSFRDSKKEGSTILHMHFFQINLLNLMVLVLAKFFRTKKIVTLHDVDPLNNRSISIIHYLSYKLMHKVIVHNEFSKGELLKKKIEPKKIVVIPHGNYMPFVDTLPPRENSDGKLHLLFFGQIKEVKGLGDLLNALANVTHLDQNIHLTIAGRPWHIDKTYYLEMITNLGIEQFVTVRFEYIPNKEVATYFKNSDIVVLPYKRIYQSGVLLLSMSYGRPCLVSDIEPFKEIIKDSENGYIFKTQSVDDLAEKIIYIKNNISSLETIRNNGLDLLSRKFDWDSIGIETKKIYS